MYSSFVDLWDSEGIKWSEIYYYERIMGIEFEGFELNTLRRASSACSAWLKEKMSPTKNNRPAGTNDKKSR